jgi:hypothetical protein
MSENAPHTTKLFIFEKKQFFFVLFCFSRWIFAAGIGTNPSDDHISAILAARRSKSVRSSSDWPSGQPGIHDFVFGRHHSELFRGTKKMKIQNSQIGLKFSNLANIVTRTKKSEKRKKIFFSCDVIDFFFDFFLEISICFDGNRLARYDLLLVDDENMG